MSISGRMRIFIKWGKRIAVLFCFCLLISQVIWLSTCVNGLPAKKQRLLGVSKIWKEAADYYALWDQTDEGMDWDRAYETAYREAAHARSNRSYYLTLRKFLANLHDGHADENVSPVNWLGFAYLPFTLEYTGDQYMIRSTADEKRFPLGSIVETVNGKETGMYLEEAWGMVCRAAHADCQGEQSCGNIFLWRKKGGFGCGLVHRA